MRQLFFVLSVLWLSGCMTTTPEIRPVQPGDTEMSCAALSREMVSLNDFIYDAERTLALSGYGNTSLDRSAQRAAQEVTEGEYSGYIRDLSGMARDMERQQARNQAFNLRKAKERRTHLQQIYQQKACG